MREMKEMLNAFALMSAKDQREGLERIHRLFDGPVPQETTKVTQLAVRDRRCSTKQSKLSTHLDLSGRTKTAQMCETLRMLRAIVEDKAREMGWSEDDVLALAAGAFRKGVIIENDQLKALQEYEAISGVSVEDSIREALEDHIECVLSVNIETIAERSAQS